MVTLKWSGILLMERYQRFASGFRAIAWCIFVVGLPAYAAAVEVPSDELGRRLGCWQNSGVSPYCDNPEIRRLVYEQYPIMVEMRRWWDDAATRDEHMRAFVFRGLVIAEQARLKNIIEKTCKVDVDCIKTAVIDATAQIYKRTGFPPREEPFDEEDIAAFAAADRAILERAEARAIEKETAAQQRRRMLAALKAKAEDKRQKSSVQRASDDAQDCASKAIFASERNSCEIAHLYTTQNFLASCAATQQRLFDNDIPIKAGCSLESRPNIVVLETGAKTPAELKEVIRTKNASGFLAAARLRISNAMRDTDTRTGENRADPFILSIVSRLEKDSSKISPPTSLLSPDEVPPWLRSKAQEFYSTASPTYKAAQADEIKKADKDFQSRYRDLPALTRSRIAVAQNDPKILRDATMPVVAARKSNKWTRDDIRDEKIAKLEGALAEKAKREGRVYRALWFWSQFRRPTEMRTIFNGNRAPRPDPDGSIYFFSGYPLERGSTVQAAMLTAWVRTYDAHCGGMLPNSPDTLRTEYLETSGPYFRRMKRLNGTDVLRFQPGLARPYIVSRDAMRSKSASQVRGNQWQMLAEMMRGGASSLSAMANVSVEPYLFALDDFDRFFRLVGCDGYVTAEC